MPLVFAPRKRTSTTYPPLAIALTGVLSANDDDAMPECPSCGGELDLSQPDADDSEALIGRCVDCDRLSLVLRSADGPLRFALRLPSRAEAVAEALALLRSR